jgi:hypothetical protein
MRFEEENLKLNLKICAVDHEQNASIRTQLRKEVSESAFDIDDSDTLMIDGNRELQLYTISPRQKVDCSFASVHTLLQSVEH